jgi:TolB-like protein
MRVAILELKADGVTPRIARVVSDMIRTEFVNIGRFIVIERNQMDQIMKEQGLQQSGCTDQECAVQLGKIMSARKILIGTISPVGPSIIINVRIVDVENSIVEFASMEKSESEAILDQAVIRLVNKLSDKIGAGGIAEERIPVPRNVKASAGDFSNRIKVSWEEVPEAEKYEIFRAENKGAEYENIDTTKSNSFDDEDAKAGITYYYKIKVKTESGLSEFSETAIGSVKAKVKKAVKEKTIEEKPAAVTMNGYYMRSIVPGWGQIYAGNSNKGYLFAGLFAASAGFSIWSAINFETKKSAYQDLSGAPKSEFDKKYSAYQKAGNMALTSFGILGAVYLVHWADALFFSKPDFAVSSADDGRQGTVFADISFIGASILHNGRQTVMTIGIRF